MLVTICTCECFQLSGSSVRLCLPSGHWSGEPPVCRVKTCRQITPPANGFVSCSSNNYAVDTVCEFGCNYGYKLIGSKKRMCLPISLWAGLPAYCKREYFVPVQFYSVLNSIAINCPRLRKPHFGEVYPSTCSTKKLYYGAQCAFACRKGFKLKGPSFRQCHGKGSWSGGQIMTRCIGNITLECPYLDNHQ